MRYISNIFLFGERFGTLTVISESRRLHREQRWKCRCDCGYEFLVLTRGLLSQKVVTCPKCAKRILRTLDPSLKTYYSQVYEEISARVSLGLNFSILEFQVWSAYKQATLESILIVRWLSALDLRDCTWRLRDFIDDYIDSTRHWQVEYERERFECTQICNRYGYDFDWIWSSLRYYYGYEHASRQFDILRKTDHKKDFLEWLQYHAEEAQCNAYKQRHLKQHPDDWGSTH